MIDDHPLDPDEQQLADRLTGQPPRPSGALRRRVRQRVGVAVWRRSLRRRSVVLATSGTALLVLAAVLALSVPR